MKRICLFAGYNSDDKILPYVFDYLEEISKYSDIYYMADSEISKKKSDISDLLKYCKNVYFVNHGKYDFGSYSELAKKYVGWDKISEYDELIFANDSCFCVQEFSQVFKKMDHTNCDAWGLLATDERNYENFYTFEEYLQIPSSKVPFFCIGSYFIAFRKQVIADLEFQGFINSVSKESDRHQVCIKYEMGLTQFLKRKKFKLSTYIDIVYRNVIIYNEQGIRLLNRGFPLVKIKTFKENPLSIKNLNNISLMIQEYVKNDRIIKYLQHANITIPENIKNIITFFFLQGEQNSTISRYKSKNKNSLDKNYIVYFNVSHNTIGGGMLSINRFIKQTINLFRNKDTTVMLSGLPLENPAINYTMFDSELPMVHFNDIVDNVFPKNLILHIPEIYLPNFINYLTDKHKNWLLSIPYLHINIMDQNHDLFPERVYFEHCKSYTDKVTITAAHSKYCTMKVAEEVDCPVTLLTPFLPKFYRSSFYKKEKIIALSPDEFVFNNISKKNETIAYLKKELPDYKVIVINDISLEEYKKLISKALFTITFGEGYDGYFIEPFLSDSVAFAVYNKTFFPLQFIDAPTVYLSFNDFIENIVKDIRLLEENKLQYQNFSKITENMIKKITNDHISTQNLIDFYANKYNFIPEICRRTGHYS